MRRFLILLALAAAMTSLSVGCGSGSSDDDATTATTTTDVDADAPGDGTDPEPTTTTTAATTTTAPLIAGPLGEIQAATRAAGLPCSDQADPPPDPSAPAAKAGVTGGIGCYDARIDIIEFASAAQRDAFVDMNVQSFCGSGGLPPDLTTIRVTYLIGGNWFIRSTGDTNPTVADPAPRTGEQNIEKIAAEMGLSPTVVDCTTYH